MIFDVQIISENGKVLDSLSKIVSSLINELKENVEKQVAEETITILVDETGNRYIDKENAQKLGWPYPNATSILSPLKGTFK